MPVPAEVILHFACLAVKQKGLLGEVLALVEAVGRILSGTAEPVTVLGKAPYLEGYKTWYWTTKDAKLLCTMLGSLC